jgi:uncharacterized protein YndB with AHSA1/START domain
MGKEFEGINEVEVAATPEQVWQAIASGPGFDSWFMGRNEVQPGADGQWRMSCFGDYTPTHHVTAWEPDKHLEYRSDTADDGRFMAYEFLVEGRGSGSTVLRMVTSGFLPGDDWADEYEAMTKGGALFWHTLATYLQHFAGRTAQPITAFGPPVTDWDRTWATLHGQLGLTAPAEGDQVRAGLDGVASIDGVVYFTNDDTLGIRTPDAMYRFLKGFHGPLIASHHIFAEIDLQASERAWQSWLDRVF